MLLVAINHNIHTLCTYNRTNLGNQLKKLPTNLEKCFGVESNSASLLLHTCS